MCILIRCGYKYYEILYSITFSFRVRLTVIFEETSSSGKMITVYSLNYFNQLLVELLIIPKVINRINLQFKQVKFVI